MSKFAKLNLCVACRTDLTSADKIVLSVVTDRIGANGVAWPGLRRIAADCGISAGGAAASLRRLEAAGLLMIDRVSGNPSRRTNRYRIGPSHDVSASSGERITARAHHGASASRRDRERSLGDAQPDQVNQTHKLKERARAGVCEKIYLRYPRKVGKRKALAAIDAALKRITARNGCADPAGWLLERVDAFAKSAAGKAGRFCPHPSTWMNAGRFDDDPKEWSANDARSDRKTSNRGGLAEHIVPPILT